MYVVDSVGVASYFPRIEWSTKKTVRNSLELFSIR